MLALGFCEADQERMLNLAERNQSNGLTQDEQMELMNYVRAGHLLTALQSKARKFKSKHAVTRRACDR
ncbi:MAG: hypothetical protein JNJ77_20535 [Planctomycetia bacterium]|nr:hypothetical protein [Planctomycetia bacterium]